MDFHSLPRRELQALCKKNSIPANMTNVAMADALRALHSVEGLELCSPTKAEPKSPPKTGRRTSTRLSARPAPPQGSPMPRSRRVSAKAPGGLRLDDSDDEEEEKATVTTRRRGRESLKKGSETAGVSVGSAIGRRSTRGKANVKKMADLAKEEEEQEEKECNKQEQEEKEMVEAPSEESAMDDLKMDDLKFSVAVSIEQVVNEVEVVVGEENNVEIEGTPKYCQTGEKVERSSTETVNDLLPGMQTLSISVEAPDDVSIDTSVEQEGLDSGNDNLVNYNASKEPEEVLAFEAMKESDEANNVDMPVEGLDSGNDNFVSDNALKEPEVLPFAAMEERDEIINVECDDDIVNNDASKGPKKVIFAEDLTLATAKESDEADNVDCVDDHVNSNEAITSLRTNNDNSSKENAGEEGKRLSMMGLGKGDLGNMSLRKLRAMYKDVKFKEGEEKRSALKALDENCLSSI